MTYFSFKPKFKNILDIMNTLLVIVGLVFAWYAVFIALPEYNEFIEKNNIPNLNGNRNIEFKTLESSYKPYIGDKNEYNIFFIGDKNHYIGKGERTKINGDSIDFNDRDRLEIEFYVRNNKIYGLFDLFGKRKTDGNFEVDLSEDNKTFQGNFIGNAAESSGLVKGTKLK